MYSDIPRVMKLNCAERASARRNFSLREACQSTSDHTITRGFLCLSEKGKREVKKITPLAFDILAGPCRSLQSVLSSSFGIAPGLQRDLRVPAFVPKKQSASGMFAQRPPAAMNVRACFTILRTNPILCCSSSMGSDMNWFCCQYPKVF